MNQRFLLMATSLLAVAIATPATSASREVEAYCVKQSEKALLPYRRAGRDAFLANCRANFAAMPAKKRKYRTKRRASR